MPEAWQITKQRANQTAGVWSLDDSFTIGGKSFDDLGDLIAAYEDLVGLRGEAEAALVEFDGAQEGAIGLIRMLGVRGAGKLDHELEDGDPLEKLLDHAYAVNPDGSVANALDRGRRFLVAWKKFDARLAAQVPPKGPFLVRGKTAAQLEAAIEAYGPAETAREELAAALSERKTNLELHNRVVDRLIKRWYGAWKAEYPPGTAEGDALDQVDVEEGTELPTALEIAGLTQEPGRHLRVNLAAGTGLHATLWQVRWQVEGEAASFSHVQEVTRAEVESGSVLLVAAFEAAKIVQVLMDVGNSRNASVLSAPVSILIAATP